MNQVGKNPFSVVTTGDPETSPVTVHRQSHFGDSTNAAPPRGRSALLTYEPYYGLKEKPFSLSADPRFLYKSRSHAQTFDDLLAGIRRREGLIVLTGDIGTGKTTLCRAVLEHLDRKTFSTFVPDPFLSREDLLKMLLIDFGVMSVDDLKSGRLNGASRPDLSYPLYEFLNTLVPLQAFAVLIIDEAQNLSLPLLEEIRILSDLEAPEKLLQVVLVGQLEFRSKLKLPEMRQLDQRVSVRCELEALDRDAVAGYIAHRLKVAGGENVRVASSAGAVDVIYRASGGVPRLINLICDRALHRGHLARTSGIDPDIVRSAIADLGLVEPPALQTSPLLASAFETPLADSLPKPLAGLSEKALTGSSDGPGAASSGRLLPSSLDSPLASSSDTRRRRLFDEDATQPEEAALDLAMDDLLFASPAIPIERSSHSERDAGEPPVPPSPDAGPALLVQERRAWRANRFLGGRRWRHRTRDLTLLAATVLLLVFAGSAVSYVRMQLDEIAQSPTLPSLPGSPLLPVASGFEPGPPLEAAPLGSAIQQPARPENSSAAAAADTGSYAIGVALFDGAQRSGRLVEELTTAGYRAYEIELKLGDRRRVHQVLVGAYMTRTDAEADAARIREIRGYADARVVAAPPPTVSH